MGIPDSGISLMGVVITGPIKRAVIAGSYTPLIRLALLPVHVTSLVTSASNAISFGPPSPAPENWLVAARIPPEYAPNFSGKNSGGNGSFKRRNG